MYPLLFLIRNRKDHSCIKNDRTVTVSKVAIMSLVELTLSFKKNVFNSDFICSCVDLCPTSFYLSPVVEADVNTLILQVQN